MTVEGLERSYWELCTKQEREVGQTSEAATATWQKVGGREAVYTV